MTSAPIIPGRRRLLALCAVSLLLHVAVLGWIARRAPRLPPAGGDAGALVLRVRLAQAQAPTPTPAAVAASPADSPPAPSRAASAAIAAVAPAVNVSIAAPATTTTADTAIPAPGGSPTLAPELLFGAPQAPLGSVPQRYRVRLPPSMQLEYTVMENAPGAPPQPADGAKLTWRTAHGAYRLQLDGAPSEGRRRDLSSVGMTTDGGMAPLDADTGAPRAAQDEASMLLLLASMGMQDPEQLQDEVRILVESNGVPAVLAFKVIGPERIASGLGPLDTLRLAQVSGPGNTRLEVWLAPAHNWMPVQLRDTGADGSVATRLVQRIAAPPD